MYRSWMKNQGIPDHEFQGKPIIGICNTWSELTPCNAHFRKLAEHVKRGILSATLAAQRPVTQWPGARGEHADEPTNPVS